jgi:hypothetical protein
VLTTPAFLPTASPQPSTLSLEEFIAETTVGAALEIVWALRYQNDGPSFRNAASAFGNRIARLFELQFYAGRQIDVYAVARARGARLLQERHGKDLDARTIAMLVAAVIEALRHAIRMELN